jgi:hypothetical protein
MNISKRVRARWGGEICRCECGESLPGDRQQRLEDDDKGTGPTHTPFPFRSPVRPLFISPSSASRPRRHSFRNPQHPTLIRAHGRARARPSSSHSHRHVAGHPSVADVDRDHHEHAEHACAVRGRARGPRPRLVRERRLQHLLHVRPPGVCCARPPPVVRPRFGHRAPRRPHISGWNAQACPQLACRIAAACAHQHPPLGDREPAAGQRAGLHIRERRRRAIEQPAFLQTTPYRSRAILARALRFTVPTVLRVPPAVGTA